MKRNQRVMDILERALAAGGRRGARDACARALAELRPMDAAGARALTAGDEGLAGALELPAPEAAQSLAARLKELAGREACLGCGTCCRKSSPTLYARDLELIGPGRLPREGLYTLRAGERASSARLGGSGMLGAELIKVGEEPGRGCIHLAGRRCGVYEHRPWQCRRLECWSGRHAGQDRDQPRLDRSMLYADDETALALAAEYEIKLPAAELTRALGAAARGGREASARVLGMMEMDHGLRRGVGARYGYQAGELRLLLGRPALEIARQYGLAAALDQRGRPALTRL